MAFVGIKVQPEIARLFREIDVPGEKVQENSYHITLLCLDDNFSINDLAKTMKSTFEVITDTHPFTFKFTKVTSFPRFEDHPIPIIVKVEGDEVHDLNEKLKKQYDKDGIEYKNNFKTYNPHMTLAYSEDDVDFKDEEIEEITVSVNEIVLYGGKNGDDKIFITFPLKSLEVKRASFLDEQAGLFEKLNSK